MSHRTRSFFWTAVLITSLFTFSLPAFAGSTYFVDAANTGQADGSSQHPFPSIQAAVNAASDDDTIMIAAGDYSEHVVITKKSLRLRGFMAEEVLLQAPGNQPAITWEDVPAGEVSGMMISHQRGSGTGIYVRHSAVYIHHNVFRDNDVAVDAELKSYGVHIVNNLFYKNGSAIRGNDITGTFRANIIREHRDTAVSIRDSDPVHMYNNLIVGNDAWAIQVRNTTVNIINNTIAYNQQGIEIDNVSSGKARIIGNIIAFNVAYGVKWSLWSDVACEIRNNDLYANGVNSLRAGMLKQNLAEDPLFRDQNSRTRAGYQLQIDSPCRKTTLRTGKGKIRKNDLGFSGDSTVW